MRRLAIVVMVAAAAATCSNGVPAAKKVSHEPVPTSPSESSPPPSQSPSPLPSPSSFRLGDVIETPSGARATVYLWDTNVDWPITPPPGKVFSRVEAKSPVRWEAADGVPPRVSVRLSGFRDPLQRVERAPTWCADVRPETSAPAT